jgi:putative DNA primase/helicase
LVQGCLKYQQEGLKMPQSVVDATVNYRNMMDVMGTCLKDICEFGENLRVPLGELYDEYVKWCDAAGEKYEATKRDFSQSMQECDFEQKKDKVKGKVEWCWFGLGLKVDPELAAKADAAF